MSTQFDDSDSDASDEGGFEFEEAPMGERGEQIEDEDGLEDEYEEPEEAALQPPTTLDPHRLGLPDAFPNFQPFEHNAPAHPRQVQLPVHFISSTAGIVREDRVGEISEADVTPEDVRYAGRSSEADRNRLGGSGSHGVGWDTPGRFFKLFFTEDEFEILVRNTNAYAEMKYAGEGAQRQWRPVQKAELKIFIG